MATIHRMHNNSVCQGLEKNTFLVTYANFLQNNGKKSSVFSLLLRSTAAAVKSGCLSNWQISIMVRYKNVFMKIFL